MSATFYGVEKVVSDLHTMPRTMRAALRAAVKQAGDELVEHVRNDKLSGQVVKRRTGKLADSIMAVMYETEDSVSVTVGSDTPYARALELGFQGTVNVRAHLRMMTQAFGRPVHDPRQIAVASHSREMNLPSRSFLQSAMNEYQGRFAELVDEAIGQVVR